MQFDEQDFANVFQDMSQDNDHELPVIAELPQLPEDGRS